MITKIKSAQHLNELELNKLLKYLLQNQLWTYYILVRLGVSTALRFRDLSSLNWEDVLHRKKIIITESKTKKTREIPLGANLQKVLLEIYSRMEKPKLSNQVIPLQIRTVNKQIKIYAAKAGIREKRISTHTLRKTFGREVWKRYNFSEESLIKLSLLFNHSSTSVTRVYLDITKMEVNELYEMDDLFSY